MLYDSRIRSVIPSTLEEQLARIYRGLEVNGRLRITRAASQQQSGAVDCGLYSIATAYHAARGDDVSKVKFAQDELREHVAMCFEQMELTPFPTTTTAVVRCREKRFNIELYCCCRMPESFDRQMIQCDICEGWFHYKCCEIIHAPGSFVCINCK